jgi:hypothetical protein
MRRSKIQPRVKLVPDASLSFTITAAFIETTDHNSPNRDCPPQVPDDGPFCDVLKGELNLHRAFHGAGLTGTGQQRSSMRRRDRGCPGGGSPSGSDPGSRVGGWPGRSLGSCLTRRVGSHHKGDPPGRPARLEVAHRVRCGV